MLIEDKNIGPCIANRNDYIAAMINQHFGNTNMQERNSKEQAQEFMDEVIRIIFKTVKIDSKNKKREENCMRHLD